MPLGSVRFTRIPRENYTPFRLFLGKGRGIADVLRNGYVPGAPRPEWTRKTGFIPRGGKPGPPAGEPPGASPSAPDADPPFRTDPVDGQS